LFFLFVLPTNECLSFRLGARNSLPIRTQSAPLEGIDCVTRRVTR
jgi:hypothetical protein